MRKFRVAHVITRLVRGGAQENTYHTVRLHRRDRFEADLIAGPPLGAEGSLEETIRAAGVQIIREPYLLRKIAPVSDMLAVRRLTRLFRERCYDIVHTHTSKAGYVARLAAKRAGVPIIVHTPHGNIFHGYFGPWPTRLFVAMERRATRWTDRIIELTERGIEESLAEDLGTREQYVSIFSGIDFSPYGAARACRAETRGALGVGDDEILVGGVGRLEPIKGFEYFVKAALHVASAARNVRFALAGQGSEERELRERAAPLGDRFAFLGHRNDVPALMAAFDVLVVPSINEGMGRVILEAAAAGTASIASDIGGIPEMIDDAKTGVLVPPKDADAIAGVLLELVRSPQRLCTMGDAARARAVPRYSVEEMVARIEALYETLIQEKGLDG